MDVTQIREIYAQLERGGAARKVGRAATTVLAMTVAAIPIAGGSLSVAIDKFGSGLSEPDVERHLLEIEQAILTAAPEIERIDALEERVHALAASLNDNAEILAAVQRTVSAAAETMLDPVILNNSAGINNVRDVIIDHMRLESTATKGGITTLENVTHTGPAQFVTDHAQQDIINTRLSGRTASQRPHSDKAP